LAATLVEDEAARMELAAAIGSAAFELDPGKGTSRVILTSLRRDGNESAPVPDPPASPAQVASLLTATRYRPPTDGELLEGVRLAVDRAHYWQPPDGEDELAARPEIREALLPIATAIASSPFAGWWTAPIRLTDQSWVEFPGSLRPATPADFTSSGALRTWRQMVDAEEERARRTRPEDLRANYSGEWGSVPPHLLRRTTGPWDGSGAVGLHLIEDRSDDWGGVDHPVTVHGNPNVYEVDWPARWAELCRRYPLEVTHSRKHDWFRATGVEGRWVLPDWLRVAAHFDAVHVSVQGYLTTAGRAVEVTEDLSSVLAGWNPDETVWLRDGFVLPEPADR
jgi:hypothetical protein